MWATILGVVLVLHTTSALQAYRMTQFDIATEQYGMLFKHIIVPAA
jgi:hypothetical protein